MTKTKLSELNLLDFGHAIQLSGAIYTGNGKLLLCMFPEEQNDRTHHELLALVLDSDDWQKVLTQTDLLDTEVTARAADGTIHKAILRKSQRQIEQTVSWNVFRRDGYACRYCARYDVPLTVDHLVCWEAGGPSTENNLVASCKKCNRTRGDLPFADWLQHPHYVRVSRELNDEMRARNTALLATLDAIPRRNHVRSR